MRYHNASLNTDQIILSLLAAQLQLAQITLQSVQVPTAYAEGLSPDVLKEFAASEAVKESIPADAFVATLQCESGWDNKALGKLGEKGIAQIYQKAHPEVTDDEAYDGLWSIIWAAQAFKDGNANWWTCYRLYETDDH